jgi:(2S)-methylsuccinyl-CoA dehydrogenase
MSLAEAQIPTGEELIATLYQAVQAVEAIFADARRSVAERVTRDGRVAPRILDREQRAAHGLAWLATYVDAIHQLGAYAERLMEADHFGEVEDHIVRIGAGEYLAQILGGISMSQGEIVRLSDLGLSSAAVAARITPAVEQLIAQGNTAPRRARLVELMKFGHDATVGASGLDDTLESIREEMRKFAEGQVVPHAQEWHLRNEYIPLDVIAQMSELGVFSLTIPEDYGGMGLGKESMCVVSEELSRGYIGVGSLGTRSEIAA